MYSINNGIMFENGKPIIGLGVSYYASFHPHKYPVPPNGDRICEMKTDLSDIKKCGFNLVRTAALGEVRWENNNVCCNFPFADSLVNEIEKNHLAAMVRLQNYSMAIRCDRNEVVQVNQNGEKMYVKDGAGAFVTDCVNHQGVIDDNRLATTEVSAHFSNFGNVILNLIYNEPSYDYVGFYDYHPESIKAYRRWLVEKGLVNAEEAENIEPPRRRPYYDEDESDWINFRTFSTQKMNDFLCDLNTYAAKGNKNSESMTCIMPVSLHPGGVKLGQDYFALAEKMDILGVTNYIPCVGTEMYFSMQFADTIESAAAAFGKHAWAAEYNAHTFLSGAEWEREAYTLLGSGFKGIIYYQWRSDYNNGKGPEIGMFGIIKNNREKTEKYETVINMNTLINKMSENLAKSERLRSEFAILYSSHSDMYFDARENGNENFSKYRNALENVSPCTYQAYFDRNVIYMSDVYTELRKENIAPSFVRACDLAKNALNIKVLILPTVVGLSDDEKRQIDCFAKAGGKVFIRQQGCRTQGYILHNSSVINITANKYCDTFDSFYYSLEDILYITGTCPMLKIISENNSVAGNILYNKTDNIYTIALTNYDNFERIQNEVRLFINKDVINNISKATFYTVDEETELSIKKDDENIMITVPYVKTGCFIVLKGDKR